MIRSIIKVIILALTLGAVNIDKLSRKIAENPDVLYKRYMDAIEVKKATAKQVKDAIGDQMAIQEGHIQTVAAKNKKIKELENDLAGTTALRDRRIKELQGKGLTPEQIKADTTLLQYLAAYKDAATTLAETKEHVASLKQTIEDQEKTIGIYVVQGQQLSKEVQDLAQKAAEAKATLALAKAQDQVNERLAGIAQGSSVDAEIADLDSIVAQAAGRAKASARMAKVEQTASHAVLQRAAQDAVAEDDFFKGTVLDSSKTDPVAEAPAPATPAAKLPE